MGNKSNDQEREKLVEATTDARVRLTRFRDILESPVLEWLRRGWAEEAERARKELEACEKKSLETLQTTIAVLDRVGYRTSVEAFEADVKRAEEELKQYDGKFPLFAGAEKKEREEAAAPEDAEEEEKDDADDSSEWASGDAAKDLADLDMNQVQETVDKVARGWKVSRESQSDDGKPDLVRLAATYTAKNGFETPARVHATGVGALVQEIRAENLGLIPPASASKGGRGRSGRKARAS